MLENIVFYYGNYGWSIILLIGLIGTFLTDDIVTRILLFLLQVVLLALQIMALMSVYLGDK